MNNRIFSTALKVISLLLPFLFFGLYLISDNPVIRMLSLALCVALILIAIIYFPLKVTTQKSRLLSQADRVQSLLLIESLDQLKKEYQKLHDTYEKLSEKKKKKVYSALTTIRSKIEDMLRAAKHVEFLTQQIGQGTLDGQRQRYQQMDELVKTLPQKEQEKWFSQLAHAREILERGW